MLADFDLTHIQPLKALPKSNNSLHTPLPNTLRASPLYKIPNEREWGTSGFGARIDVIEA
jgi:hypothetical protein